MAYYKKLLLSIFILFFPVFLVNCEKKIDPLNAQDIRLIQNLEEENQKVHDFLMQTENGMPSVQGLLTAVYALESSENETVSTMAKNMKENLQSIERKDKEKDYEFFSKFSLDLIQLVRSAEISDVYKFYCPMNKKFWVAEKKGIQNPYSPEMRNCGDLIIE